MFIFSKVKRNLKSYTRWGKYYTWHERHDKVPNKTIYEFFRDYAKNHLEQNAIEYFGKHYTYGQMLEIISDTADSFMSLGVKRYDIVTIIMPNTPEALFAFYAVSKIGAVANMLHPLSSEVEINNCLKNRILFKNGKKIC